MLIEQHTLYDGSTEATILLQDFHQEYTACWNENYSPGPYFSAQVIWDDDDLLDLINALRPGQPDPEEQLLLAKSLVFGTKLGEMTDYFGADQWTLWRIRGSIDGLGHAWSILGDALTTTVSGDSDCFDYWPNTMDMLFDMAKDMDALMGGSYRKATLQIAKATLDNSAGAVMPYSSEIRNEAEQAYMRALLISEWGYPERWTDD